MRRLDHDDAQQWLHLELDGELAAEEAGLLRDHLESCPDCRAARQSLQRLQRLLESDRVAVRTGFSSQVMAVLPPAGWEGRALRAWRWPLALLALLVASAVALVSVGTAQVSSGSSVLTALTIVAQLFQVSLLAGAGLLAASWKGVGMAVGEVLASSAMTKVAFLVVVIGVNGLLIALLRRRRAAAVRVHRGKSSPGRTHD